jgi:hypothetical protein
VRENTPTDEAATLDSAMHTRDRGITKTLSVIHALAGAASSIMIRRQLADTRDQFVAVLNSVRPGIVAADQGACGAQLV